ncbi:MULTISPECIES: hypothetical protein [Micrococcaceae]|jgi:hypothetical protein|uniref:hypothetical protein n=1 Tax=Micrococcaceae TaxID=1268 RepID=UPI0010E5132A|nr:MULTISPECIES: hypothetical protein [Micrococcaceae]UKA52137.1 hypothetical protein LFT48_12425 [Arthrobacter sp. FW305-123]MCX8452789.1 hypothetical protein [Paenarthrobacter ureafaciens]MCY0971427.1 hypothetical protein [Paenarthrobacter ureafaciens]TDT82288.1 hypothetical protein DFO47_102211 [Arthrobacter sp. AG258]WOC59493.1 hypothetical protein RI444_13220 [Paenarthrobacter sp. AT5]
METNRPAAVPDRDDAAARTATEGFTGFDVQNQAVGGCCDGVDVEALDTEQRIRRACTSGHRNKT